MPLYVNRSPTILSLNQYGEASEVYERLSAKLTPDAAVKEVYGSYLPTYNYASGTVVKSKRVRSFGDLLTVPDIDSFVR